MKYSVCSILMARLNIFPSNLFFMQPLSHAGHMTDRIRAFAVRSLHVFNTLIAQRWMIDKTPWSCGGAGCNSERGSGYLGWFQGNSQAPLRLPFLPYLCRYQFVPMPSRGRAAQTRSSPGVGRWRTIVVGGGRLLACMPLRQPVVVPLLIVLLF